MKKNIYQNCHENAYSKISSWIPRDILPRLELAGKTRQTDGDEVDPRDGKVTLDVGNSGYNADVDKQKPFSVEDPRWKDHRYDSQSFYHIEHISAIIIVIFVVIFDKYIFVTGTVILSACFAKNTCTTGIRSTKRRLASSPAATSSPRS